MDFEKEAAVWDAEPRRVKLAHDVAEAMIREIKPTQDMDVLEVGCGTGLVTLRLQPLVRRITGVDTSPAMLAVFQGKVKQQGLTNVYPQLLDLEQGGQVAGRFHLLVSSMTMHHVEDTAALLRGWFDLLLPGGWLGVADLDTEDGSFHGDHRGVYHFGFARDGLQALLEKTGFRQVRATTAATITKEVSGAGQREYSVFLLVGRK
ncbi:MAG: methyltransferase domain-containing protein [Deltaproteobacteria bacterium]|nr:methyltransferase domain-containing protein [Deltaproteobacteria bacterium]